jgi:hypothetical protein
MLTYQHEKFDDYYSEVKDLWQQHYEEIAERTDVIKLDPDVDRYKYLEQNGMLEIHTVRDDGTLIGYSLWFLSYNIHYKKSYVASSDILYIAPSHRKGMTGIKFIKWTIAEIKKQNPQKIVFHVKPIKDYGHILERLGANYFEKLYSIVLE